MYEKKGVAKQGKTRAAVEMMLRNHQNSQIRPKKENGVIGPIPT